MPADTCPTCADLDALRLEHTAWGVMLDAARRDRDEARAVFRDAVHMMAHIARAAGFDPEDPTVEPPAIVARVERLRAERDALASRLDALTAPVEGVDVEEVLRLDREATPGLWSATVDTHDGGWCRDLFPRGPTTKIPWSPQHRQTPEQHAEEWASLELAAQRDADLIATYRTAAPVLAREVVALRDTLGRAQSALGGEIEARRAAEQERDRLHDRIEGALSAALGDPVMSIHDGDGPTAPDLESLIKLAGQIRRERDELRLTLAAERGEQAGAPHPDWTPLPTGWSRSYPDGEIGIVNSDGSWWRGRYGYAARVVGKAPAQRAAMLAADKATG